MRISATDLYGSIGEYLNERSQELLLDDEPVIGSKEVKARAMEALGIDTHADGDGYGNLLEELENEISLEEYLESCASVQNTVLANAV